MISIYRRGYVVCLPLFPFSIFAYKKAAMDSQPFINIYMRSRLYRMCDLKKNSPLHIFAESQPMTLLNYMQIYHLEKYEYLLLRFFPLLCFANVFPASALTPYSHLWMMYDFREGLFFNLIMARGYLQFAFISLLYLNL